MTLVRTLLAVWLALAVPAAGAAVSAAAPDCSDHATAPAHEAHGEHGGAKTEGSHADCDCQCGGLHCVGGFSLSGTPALPPNALPKPGWLSPGATAGLTAPLPDHPFRPPISA